MAKELIKSCNGTECDPCDECNGTGDCQNCQGIGEVECGHCGSDDECEECHGSGDCVECDGTGNLGEMFRHERNPLTDTPPQWKCDTCGKVEIIDDDPGTAPMFGAGGAD